MISTLLVLIEKIALMIALGYWLRKRNIITAQFQTDITSFMMKVALPANVLTAANNAFSKELSSNLLITALIGLLYYILAIFLSKAISRFLPLNARSKSLFVVLAVFANTAFIGFPLAQDLLGSEGLLYAIIFNMTWILFFFTLGSSMLSGGKMHLKSIITTPVSVASIIAIALYFTPFRFPVAIQETLSAIGGMVVPISMMLIGCSLVPIHFTEILKDRYAYFVSALRLVIYPLLVLFILKMIPAVPAKVALICSLSCCLPSGSLCVIFAQQYDCDPAYASRAVVQGMLLMIVTIPCFITIATSVLGL